MKGRSNLAPTEKTTFKNPRLVRVLGLKIDSVNVTKSSGNGGFGHMKMKTSLFV